MARTPKTRTDRKDEMIGIQVGAAMKQELLDLARKQDVPMSQLVRQALKEFMEKAA